MSLIGIAVLFLYRRFKLSRESSFSAAASGPGVLWGGGCLEVPSSWWEACFCF